MTEEINERSSSSPDHQLPPYAETVPRHKGRHTLLWSLLVLGLVIVVVLFYRDHANNVKQASVARPAPGIA